jgi:hypothetical protein
MTYGKLVDGAFEPLIKKYVHENNRIYVNQTSEELLELGYKPVEVTEQPPQAEGKEIVPVWAETDAEIVEHWKYQDAPTEPIEVTE